MKRTVGYLLGTMLKSAAKTLGVLIVLYPLVRYPVARKKGKITRWLERYADGPTQSHPLTQKEAT